MMFGRTAGEFAVGLITMCTRYTDARPELLTGT